MGAGKYAIVLLVLSAVFANSLPMEAVDVRLADQFLEMLAQGIEPPEDTPDPVAFARRLSFDPDPWQAEMLRSDASRVLLNCSRQSGKSTTTAVLALYTAIYRPNSSILVLSPSLRQSSELFRKVHDFKGRASVATREETKLSMVLANGSRMVALPGKEGTIRGFSDIDLLVVDEAARVPDELYYAIRPMLAVSGGRLIALSTPFGKRGWFFDAWMKGDAWFRIKVPATQCPRIGAEFLEEERVALGDFWFEQEYMCVFHDDILATFTYDEITGMFREEVEMWDLLV
jgi:hypothetical protein